MSTENLIYIIILANCLAGIKLLIYIKTKKPNIVKNLSYFFDLFIIKKKILEIEFEFNNKSFGLTNFISNPEVLKNFQNTICKTIYTHLNPKPTTLEICQYFESIFIQKKLLYDGLTQLSTKKSEINFTKTFYDFVNFQVDSISTPTLFKDIKNLNWDVFQSIEGIFINDPSIGYKILIDSLNETLEKEGVEKLVIYNWLIKNKGHVFIVNENNIVFKDFYEDIINDFINRINFEKLTIETKELVYQKPILTIDELLIPPMTKQIFKFNYSKIGIFDTDGVFTGKILNIKKDLTSLTLFPKNAIYKLFENLFYPGEGKIKYMKPFPINLIEDDIARLINEFLELKKPLKKNNITKRNPGTYKFDNIDKTLKNLIIEIKL